MHLQRYFPCSLRIILGGKSVDRITKWYVTIKLLFLARARFFLDNFNFKKSIFAAKSIRTCLIAIIFNNLMHLRILLENLPFSLGSSEILQTIKRFFQQITNYQNISFKSEFVSLFCPNILFTNLIMTKSAERESKEFIYLYERGKNDSNQIFCTIYLSILMHIKKTVIRRDVPHSTDWMNDVLIHFHLNTSKTWTSLINL